MRQRTDALDALGNTTAATGKGFAIGSAVLTALALLSAFEKEVAGGGGQLSADIVLDRMVQRSFSASLWVWATAQGSCGRMLQQWLPAQSNHQAVGWVWSFTGWSVHPTRCSVLCGAAFHWFALAL